MYDKEKLRKFMLYNKTFLAELQAANKMVAKKVLISANDSQIRLLFHVLYFITGD